ncbi:LuxR C-terminal-related transcriptional regulator [Chloroflexota bacterium]
MTTLINDLAGTSEFLLILDDYHVIDSDPIQDALTFLLNHLPPQMHLVIATRTGPRLPLSRLRGRGQLSELRADDLRFTTPETTAFLKQIAGLNLSEANVTALEARTEGWITGLQLAAHFMQGQGADRISDFISTFTGDNRYIVMNLASEHQAWPFPPTGAAYVGMGNLLREWNELETATQHLLKGIELISPAGYASVVSQAYSILAYIRQAQDKSDEATAFLQQAEELAQKAGGHPVGVRMPMTRTRLWLMQDNLEAATQWADRYQAQREPEQIILAYQRQFAEITVARVRLAQGQPDLDLLSDLLQTAQAAGWQRNVIELLILQALSFSLQGDSGQAVTILEKALALAEPEGYVRLFVDEGVPMANLLRIVVRQGIYPAYTGKLQASFMPLVGEGKISAQALIDPLTNRELEVLKLMATGLSNREIAAELVVALGTVAKYSNNIFTKLNVRNQTEAILRARALDLL